MAVTSVVTIGVSSLLMVLIGTSLVGLTPAYYMVLVVVFATIGLIFLLTTWRRNHTNQL